MEAKQDLHTFVGMQQDVAPSQCDSRFLYEAHNIRLTAREGDTLLTMTNERGPQRYKGIPSGTFLGHCVLNQYIVLFTTTGSKDNIYRIDTSSDELKLLFSGALNFSTEHPIEALACYENEGIQKVYWTDGYNQPRVINIVGDTSLMRNYSFDFVQELSLGETVTVDKMLNAAGIFAPGTIQYAFTYYNKYGQESNIFYTTPILYTSYADRGGSPEESMSNAFRVTVSGIDTRFDFMRIYSIQRTSVNVTPVVKKVTDIDIRRDKSTTTYTYGYVYKFNALDETIKDDYQFILDEDCYLYGASGKTPLTDMTHYSSTSDGVTTYIFDMSYWGGQNALKFTSHGTVGSIRHMAYRLESSYSSGQRMFLTTEDGKVTSVSFDAGVTVTECEDILEYPVSEWESPTSVSYVDTGTSGESVDPTALLYIGGEEIMAGTIEQKDGTLFLGNIEISRPQVDDGDGVIKKALQNAFTSVTCATRKALLSTSEKRASISDNDYYQYYSSMNATSDSHSVNTAGFKAREYYRLGVQFQYKNGKWSDPVMLKDVRQTNNPKFYTSSAYNDGVVIPTFNALMSDTSILSTLYSKGYRKARPVVVFPQSHERTVVCQGVVNPTMYTDKHRSTDKDLYAQASWFCRPISSSTYDANYAYDSSTGTCSPTYSGTIPYNKACFNTNLKKKQIGILSGESGEAVAVYGAKPSRFAEIQGVYDEEDQFKIDWKMITLNSPEFVFDTQETIFNYDTIYARLVGYASIENTMSDIDIQTKTPTISTDGTGFIKKSFMSGKARGIISGLFYEDFLCDDVASDSSYADEGYSKGDVAPTNDTDYAVKYLVYPWSKEGALNNDFTRPANHGTMSSELLKKCISNLRYADTYWMDDIVDLKSYMEDVPEIFTSDQMQMAKLREGTYYGNIDTLLTPSDYYGQILCLGPSTSDCPSVAKITASSGLTDYFKNIYATPDFTADTGWATLAYDKDNNVNGLYSLGTAKITDTNSHSWYQVNAVLGNVYPASCRSKAPVRMKYKSTPHLVMNFSDPLSNMVHPSADTPYVLPIVEMYREYDEETMFGGTSEDALKANLWLPCGEPVTISTSAVTLTLKYSYGDTWYQRFDCLKTYPFTFEDHNQIVEIISFPVESHINMDGRYDRNRGQLDNLTMSPTNFNLHNAVYSQNDNYFNYRIADEDYYKLNRFDNQFTWSTQKNAASDVDDWTDITLASTYDTDGDKGPIEAIRLWNDKLVCFQTNGISIINFNVKNEIPVKEGAPIEITNSYRVDGVTYVLTNMGCKNKWGIQIAPAGIYFVDSVSGDLQMLSQNTTNLSQAKNMQIWSSKQYLDSWTPENYTSQLFYDVINGDLYYNTEDTSLGFSEQTTYFTSFYSYGGVDRMFNVGNTFYAVKNNAVYKMYKGTPNLFFGRYEPYDFTFVCNGSNTNSSTEFPSDKIFTNLEFRADRWTEKFGGTLSDAQPLDYVHIWNEYQNSKRVLLELNDRRTINLAKQYRIWRVQLPRDAVNKRDRIRNPWCKIKLGCYDNNDRQNSELFNIHDVMVTYQI